MKTSQIPIKQAVECGKPVPGDWNKWLGQSMREISSIRHKIPFARYESYPVCGESLKPVGIYDGDYLVCRETAYYIPGRIGIWQTPNGQTAKYAEMDGSFVTLHNQNGWSERWSVDDVSLVAIVVRVERDYE